MHDDVCWKAPTQLSRSQSRSVTMIHFSSAVILSGTLECHRRSIEGNSSPCRAGLRPYDRWRRARPVLVGLYENLGAPRSCDVPVALAAADLGLWLCRDSRRYRRTPRSTELPRASCRNTRIRTLYSRALA